MGQRVYSNHTSQCVKNGGGYNTPKNRQTRRYPGEKKKNERKECTIHKVPALTGNAQFQEVPQNLREMSTAARERRCGDASS